jgi:hypothetical protein
MEPFHNIGFECTQDSVSRLDNIDRSIRIAVMCHNSYHSDVSHISSVCILKINTYGNSTSYFKSHKRVNNDNYDIILLASKAPFNEGELESLKAIACDISIKASKKVTFGYEYLNSIESQNAGMDFSLIANSYNQGQLENDQPFIGTKGYLPDTPIISLAALSRIHDLKTKESETSYVEVTEKQIVAAALANLFNRNKTSINHDEIIQLTVGIANKVKGIRITDKIKSDNENVFDYFVSYDEKQNFYFIKPAYGLDKDITNELHSFGLYVDMPNITLRTFLNDFSVPELNQNFTEHREKQKALLQPKSHSSEAEDKV